MTSRGARNVQWIENHCRVPEGKFVGQQVRLRPWQRKVVRGIYDSPTRRAIISFGRKNAKTSLAAFLTLLHLCGPEAVANSQLFSAAQSRDQAAVMFALAAKCVRLSPELTPFVTVRDTTKQLFCPELGTLYRALSAEVATSFGVSPAFVVHDELGQVRGERSALYESLETAAGAHENPLSLVISTQAPSDGDLLSKLIDDAATGADPKTKLFLFTADLELDPFSVKAMKAANPALGDFLNAEEVKQQAEQARRMPGMEASYRNLVLNQRVEVKSPFVTRAIWQENTRPLSAPLDGRDVFAALDLSAVSDLTALEAGAAVKDSNDWDIESHYWLPEDGLAEKSRHDRVPYDLWKQQGFLKTTPGRAIRYEFIAHELRALFDRCNVRGVAFDRYNMKFLKPELERVGFSEEELERFIDFGQGFVSMGPALRALETMLLTANLRTGGHPVLTMCMMNARTIEDPARNRKFVKPSATARIDGAVCLAMFAGIVASNAAVEQEGPSFWESAAA